MIIVEHVSITTILQTYQPSLVTIELVTFNHVHFKYHPVYYIILLIEDCVTILLPITTVIYKSSAFYK